MDTQTPPAELGQNNGREPIEQDKSGASRGVQKINRGHVRLGMLTSGKLTSRALARMKLREEIRKREQDEARAMNQPENEANEELNQPRAEAAHEQLVEDDNDDVIFIAAFFDGNVVERNHQFDENRPIVQENNQEELLADEAVDDDILHARGLGECKMCGAECPIDPQACIMCCRMIGCKSCIDAWNQYGRTCPNCMHKWTGLPEVDSAFGFDL